MGPARVRRASRGDGCRVCTTRRQNPVYDIKKVPLAGQSERVIGKRLQMLRQSERGSQLELRAVLNKEGIIGDVNRADTNFLWGCLSTAKKNAVKLTIFLDLLVSNGCISA